MFKAKLNKLIWESVSEIFAAAYNIAAVAGNAIAFVLFVIFADLDQFQLFMAFCGFNFILGGLTKIKLFYICSTPLWLWLIYKWVYLFLGPFIWLFLLGIVCTMIVSFFDWSNDKNDINLEPIIIEKTRSSSFWLFILPFIIMMFSSACIVCYLILCFVFLIFFETPTNAIISGVISIGIFLFALRTLYLDLSR